VPDGHFEVRIGALLTPSRERNMDLPRSDFAKPAVLGSIAVETGDFSRVNNLFEPLVGLTAAAQPALILADEFTPTAHDPSARLVARPWAHRSQLGKSLLLHLRYGSSPRDRRVMT
jgi:hypothetical protein